VSRNPAAKGAPDANHADVVGWYEDLGCSVVDTHGVGGGFPDTVIGIAGVTCLVEIKTETGILLPSQIRFQRDWRGSKVQVSRTLGDVIAHVQSVRRLVAKGVTR
jgi:hypothetical protein